jgi:hypothetical protein
VVRSRLAPYFHAVGGPYPPSSVTLVGLKEERRLLLYARAADGGMQWIRSYPILGASGGPGPKLRRGDRQVPEGIYRVESLNPNSRYHLALRVGYPSEWDRQQARRDGRSDLGGDIMIHGGDASIGCIAIGDEAAEDLFVLAADVGLANMHMILAPVDFRRGTVPPSADQPPWVGELYRRIRAELSTLPATSEAEASAPAPSLGGR